MRVGMLLPRYLDQPTGIVNYSRHLVGSLAGTASDIELTVLSRSRGRLPGWLDGLPVVEVANVPAAKMWLSLSRVAADCGLDVVHGTGNTALFIGPSKGVRRVVTVHDIGALVLPGDRPVRDRVAHAVAIPLLRSTADAVITDSQASADDLLRAGIGPEQLTVIPLGADRPKPASMQLAKEMRTRLELPGPYFLTIGDLAAHKNLERVVRAFGTVAPRLPNVTLVVAGKEGHGSDAIRVLTKDLGGRVRLVGFVSNEERDVLYEGATALVSVSLFEGFGLPALEAMTRGTPVIASNCTSLPELTGDAALLVDPRSIRQIAQAMERVATDSGLADDLGLRGRRRAQKFTVEEMARRTSEVYRSVCEAVGSGRHTRQSLGQTVRFGVSSARLLTAAISGRPSRSLAPGSYIS